MTSVPMASSRSGLLGAAAVVLAYACALNFNGMDAALPLILPVTLMALAWAGALVLRDLRLGRLALPGGWVPLVMLGFFGWLLLSTFWSSYPYTSFLYVWIVGALPLWCLLWLKTPTSAQDWNRLWSALLVIQAGLLAWGLYDYLGAGKRASGPQIDSNAFGALVNLFFFPALFRLIELQRQKAAAWLLWAYRLLVVVSLLALFASYSRGALLAWGLLMLPVMAILLSTQRSRRLKLGVVMLVLVTVAVGALTTLRYRDATAFDRPSLFDPNQPAIQHRLHMNRSTWEIYRDHPWLGTGLATFNFYYPAYRSPAETSSAGFHAHNDYLEFLQEGGPILLLFLLLCALASAQPIGRALVKAVTGRHDARAPSLESLGLAFGLCALFIQAAVNFIFYLLPHCLIAGLFIAQLHKGHAGAEKSLALRLPAIIALPVLIVLLALPAYRLSLTVVSETVFRYPQTWATARHIRSDSERYHRFTQRMATLQPDNLVPHAMLALFNHAMAVDEEEDVTPDERLAYAQEALWHYTNALDAMPVNATTYLGLARLLIGHPQLAEHVPSGISNDPETLLRSAIRYSPSRTAAYVELAEYHLARGETRKAYDVLLPALDWLAVSGPYSSERVSLLEKILLLAQTLGIEDQVEGTARRLQALQPDNALATKALDPSRVMPKPTH